MLSGEYEKSFVYLMVKNLSKLYMRKVRKDFAENTLILEVESEN